MEVKREPVEERVHPVLNDVLVLVFQEFIVKCKSWKGVIFWSTSQREFWQREDNRWPPFEEEWGRWTNR